MLEEFEHEGFWWLPSHEEDRVTGTLTFSRQDGLILTLLSVEQAGNPFGPLADHPVVLGVTLKNKPITLCNCMESRRTLGLVGAMMESEYRAEVSYIGAHFADPEEAAFDRVKARFTWLPDWTGLYGIKFRTKKGNHDVEIAYSHPDQLRVDRGGSALALTYSWYTEWDTRRQISLGQTFWILVKLENSLHLGDFMSAYIGPFQDFLTLATRRPNAIVEMQAFLPKATDPDRHRRPITIVFNQLATWERRSRGKALHRGDMLFSLKDIQPCFPTIVSNWLDIAKELRTVRGLFFGTQYRPSPYVETRFLNLAFALECYHRERVGGEVLDTSEHENRVNSILAAVPDEHTQWLSEKLRYSNEPSFRRRVRHLLRNAALVMSPLVRDEKRFVQTVTATRNYLVHRDVALRPMAATSGADVDLLSSLLSVLAESWLLHDMGFSWERSRRLFEQNRHYGWLRDERVPQSGW